MGRHCAAERLLNLLDQAGQVDVFRIDLVDDDHAAEFAFFDAMHEPAGDGFDARGRVDHHHRRLHRGERGDRLAEKVRGPGRVDQVEVRILIIAVEDCVVEAVAVLFFFVGEVAEGGALFDFAHVADDAGRAHGASTSVVLPAPA